MRVMLLNPSIRAEQFGRFAPLLEAMPCVGVAYIATFLAQAGHEVTVYDDFALRGGDAAVLDLVERIRPALRPGAIVIDCSTVSADTARSAAGSLAGAGVAFLDCPVSGGVEGAGGEVVRCCCGAPACRGVL